MGAKVIAFRLFWLIFMSILMMKLYGLFVHFFGSGSLIDGIRLDSSNVILSSPVIDKEKGKISPQDIKLLTFNIRHGADEWGRENLDSIIQEIKNCKAQIIALQEVDRYMPRSGFKDQAKEIARALDYNYVYGETISIFGIKYGNVLLSAYPIIEYENLQLPSESLEARGLIKAKIDIKGSIYSVFVTHLGLNHKEREKQIKVINEEVSGEKERAILMGDFNAHPTSAEMKNLCNDFIDTAAVLGKSHMNTYAFYSKKPNTRIDRIYTSKDIEVKDHFVLPSKISDHFMVISVISQKIKE